MAQYGQGLPKGPSVYKKTAPKSAVSQVLDAIGAPGRGLQRIVFSPLREVFDAIDGDESTKFAVSEMLGLSGTQGATAQELFTEQPLLKRLPSQVKIPLVLSADVLIDPLNLVSGPIMAGVKGGRYAAKAVSALDDVVDVIKAGEAVTKANKAKVLWKTLRGTADAEEAAQLGLKVGHVYDVKKAQQATLASGRKGASRAAAELRYVGSAQAPEIAREAAGITQTLSLRLPFSGGMAVAIPGTEGIARAMSTAGGKVFRGPFAKMMDWVDAAKVGSKVPGAYDIGKAGPAMRRAAAADMHEEIPEGMLRLYQTRDGAWTTSYLKGIEESVPEVGVGSVDVPSAALTGAGGDLTKLDPALLADENVVFNPVPTQLLETTTAIKASRLKEGVIASTGAHMVRSANEAGDAAGVPKFQREANTAPNLYLDEVNVSGSQVETIVIDTIARMGDQLANPKEGLGLPQELVDDWMTSAVAHIKDSAKELTDNPEALKEAVSEGKGLIYLLDEEGRRAGQMVAAYAIDGVFAEAAAVSKGLFRYANASVVADIGKATSAAQKAMKGLVRPDGSPILLFDLLTGKTSLGEVQKALIGVGYTRDEYRPIIEALRGRVSDLARKKAGDPYGFVSSLHNKSLEELRQIIADTLEAGSSVQDVLIPLGVEKNLLEAERARFQNLTELLATGNEAALVPEDWQLLSDLLDTNEITESAFLRLLTSDEDAGVAFGPVIPKLSDEVIEQRAAEGVRRYMLQKYGVASAEDYAQQKTAKWLSDKAAAAEMRRLAEEARDAAKAEVRRLEDDLDGVRDEVREAFDATNDVDAAVTRLVGRGGPEEPPPATGGPRPGPTPPAPPAAPSLVGGVEGFPATVEELADRLNNLEYASGSELFTVDPETGKILFQLDYYQWEQVVGRLAEFDERVLGIDRNFNANTLPRDYKRYNDPDKKGLLDVLLDDPDMQDVIEFPVDSEEIAKLIDDASVLGADIEQRADGVYMRMVVPDMEATFAKLEHKWQMNLDSERANVGTEWAATPDKQAKTAMMGEAANTISDVLDNAVDNGFLEHRFDTFVLETDTLADMRGVDSVFPKQVAPAAERAGGQAAEQAAKTGFEDPLIIIACGGSKLDRAAPAAELYTGPLFKSSLAWARSVAPDDRIRILSAKHGLVKLDQVLEPYDVKLGDPGTKTIWPEKVTEQATEQGLYGQNVVVVGSQQYSNFVNDAMGGWTKVHAPFTAGRAQSTIEGKWTIGKARQAMNRNAGTIPGLESYAASEQLTDEGKALLELVNSGEAKGTITAEEAADSRAKIAAENKAPEAPAGQAPVVDRVAFYQATKNLKKEEGATRALLVNAVYIPDEGGRYLIAQHAFGWMADEMQVRDASNIRGMRVTFDNEKGVKTTLTVREVRPPQRQGQPATVIFEEYAPDVLSYRSDKGFIANDAKDFPKKLVGKKDGLTVYITPSVKHADVIRATTKLPEEAQRLVDEAAVLMSKSIKLDKIDTTGRPPSGQGSTFESLADAMFFTPSDGSPITISNLNNGRGMMDRMESYGQINSEYADWMRNKFDEVEQQIRDSISTTSEVVPPVQQRSAIPYASDEKVVQNVLNRVQLEWEAAGDTSVNPFDTMRDTLASKRTRADFKAYLRTLDATKKVAAANNMTVDDLIDEVVDDVIERWLDELDGASLRYDPEDPSTWLKKTDKGSVSWKGVVEPLNAYWRSVREAPLSKVPQAVKDKVKLGETLHEKRIIGNSLRDKGKQIAGQVAKQTEEATGVRPKLVETGSPEAKGVTEVRSAAQAKEALAGMPGPAAAGAGAPPPPPPPPINVPGMSPEEWNNLRLEVQRYADAKAGLNNAKEQRVLADKNLSLAKLRENKFRGAEPAPGSPLYQSWLKEYDGLAATRYKAELKVRQAAENTRYETERKAMAKAMRIRDERDKTIAKQLGKYQMKEQQAATKIAGLEKQARQLETLFGQVMAREMQFIAAAQHATDMQLLAFEHMRNNVGKSTLAATAQLQRLGVTLNSAGDADATFFEAVSLLDDLNRQIVERTTGMKMVEMEIGKSKFLVTDTVKKIVQPQEGYDKFNALTKLWRAMAIMRPGFSNRNFIGAWLNNRIQGVVYDDYAKAAVFVSRLLKNEALPSMPDYMTREDFWEAMVVLTRDGQRFGDAAAGVSIFGKGQGWIEAMSSWLDKNAIAKQTYVTGRRAGDDAIRKEARLVARELTVEQQVRMANYIGLRRQGLTHDMAIDQTFTYHFDYSDLSAMDRKIRRWVPFWTYRSRTLALHAQLLVHTPEAVRSLWVAREDLRKNSGGNLPPWLSGLQLPWGDSVMDFNFVPAGDAIRMMDILGGWRVNGAETLGSFASQMLGGIAPTIAEGIFNRDLFTHNRIFESTDPAPQQFGDVAWHLLRSFGVVDQLYSTPKGLLDSSRTGGERVAGLVSSLGLSPSYKNFTPA